jgi:uncharacterized protein (DUF58 family)
MLASQLLARARRVRIHGRGPAWAALTGEYRSAYRGSGMEFEESREYAPGDDVSAIDWKVTARLGRPFVKRFREERQRTVMLAVDASRSMAFGTPGPSLYETAAEAAVVVAISCAASRDRVGCLVFADRVVRFVPPGKGPTQAFAVAAALAETGPDGPATDPAPALALAGATLRHRSILFVFSDFLAEGFAPNLGRLAARHDVTAAFVAAPDPDRLPRQGLVTVADLESGQRALLDCGNPRVRERFAKARREGRDRAMAALRALGADILELPAAGPMAPTLAAFFRRRERRR